MCSHEAQETLPCRVKPGVGGEDGPWAVDLLRRSRLELQVSENSTFATGLLGNNEGVFAKIGG